MNDTTPIARNWRAIAHAALALILATILGLWAWNTLAPPFGAPELEFRHALAAAILLSLIRTAALPGRRWNRHALHG
jgi:hypothetical protein